MVEFKSVKDLIKEKSPRLQEFNHVFQEAAFLIGIKDHISKPNKEDIVDMIKRDHSNLSIEAIREAFKMDRFGTFGEPTQSFQLFNSEFVGKILKRFKEWLRKTRFENNLPMTNEPLNILPELSEEEKSQLIINGVVTCFEDYKKSGSIDPGRLYVYEFLYGRRLLPEHNQDFRDRIKDQAQAQAIKVTEAKRLAARGNRDERTRLKHKINDLKAGNYSLRAQCRTIILKEYFDQLINSKQNINDVI